MICNISPDSCQYTRLLSVIRKVRKTEFKGPKEMFMCSFISIATIVCLGQQGVIKRSKSFLEELINQPQIPIIVISFVICLSQGSMCYIFQRFRVRR